MAISWVLPVRAVQLVCAIIVLGTSAYTVSQYPGEFNTGAYNVFTALWTILVAAFFIATSFIGSDSIAANPIVNLVLDGLSWVFWLAAFASMAAFLNKFDDFNLVGNFFGSVKASIAFGVIEWLLFTATLIWNGLSGFRGSKTSTTPGA